MKSDKSYWKNKWAGLPLLQVNSFAKKCWNFVKSQKPKNLLDLGAGNGRDSIFFANKGLKVTAVEFSKSGHREIEKIAHKNIKAVQQDMKNLKFSKNSFDIVYAHLSLHYFSDEDTDRIFEKIYNVLKPGGYLFVKCKSTDDALYGKGKKLAGDIYFKGHTRHFFSKEYMKEKLHKYKIKKIRKTTSVYHRYKSSFIEAIVTK